MNISDVLNQPLFEDAAAVLYRGSVAHGMHVPKNDPNSIDDVDLMAVWVGSEKHYFSGAQFGQHGTVEKWIEQYDIVAYEASKFIRLLAQGNPNVITALWLDEDKVLKSSWAWRFLGQNRHLFMTRNFITALIGYAEGQFHRMKNPAGINSELQDVTDELLRRGIDPTTL